jgi:hypothetical protein
MMVTQAAAPPALGGDPIDSAGYWSIVLAVAQWRRNPVVTQAAILRLRGYGVSETEIFARRRASSCDPKLAALLRLAVTIAIARGALTAADRQFIERHALDGLLTYVDTYVADALAFAAAARLAPAAALDMDVGDY